MAPVSLTIRKVLQLLEIHLSFYEPLSREEITGCFECEAPGSQSLEERAAGSRGNSQSVLIFDTISKRSEMITTNGGVNNPSVAKGICPKAGNCSRTQLPIPDCGPHGWLAGSVAL